MVVDANMEKGKGSGKGWGGVGQGGSQYRIYLDPSRIALQELLQ